MVKKLHSKLALSYASALLTAYCSSGLLLGHDLHLSYFTKYPLISRKACSLVNVVQEYCGLVWKVYLLYHCVDLGSNSVLIPAMLFSVNVIVYICFDIPASSTSINNLLLLQYC